MHHKFAIIDSRLVLTGSYNWTRSAAAYNHENILVTGNKQVVNSFEKEFSRLWQELEMY
jgi:phosphatidylserine/phosphatidylglycerophosphate/cardiolipin synthase-like enzyme